MLEKLSTYNILSEGYNHTASALFRENNIEIRNNEDFERLFPDQLHPISKFKEFLDYMEVLIGTSKFVEKIKNFKHDKKICILGDYDVDRDFRNGYNVMQLKDTWIRRDLFHS